MADEKFPVESTHVLTFARERHRKDRVGFGGPMTAPFDVGQAFSKVLVEDLKRTQLVQYAGASDEVEVFAGTTSAHLEDQ